MDDLRYAVRSLARTRTVSAVAVGTLALGIAATVTMSSVAYAALLRPLPFPDPDRLVLLFTTRTTPRDGRTLTRWSRSLIGTLDESVRSFESIASFTASLVAIGGGRGAPEQIDGEIVSPDYFSALRVKPMLGRTFTANEDRAPGDAPVVVLSEGLWRERFGADVSILGTPAMVNGVSLTVIGVLPAAFRGLSDKSRVWIPRTMAPLLTYEDYLTTPQRFIGVVARLKPGVTLEQANAELAAKSAAFREPNARPDEQWGAVAQRIGDARVEPTERRSVLMLLGAAACLLLITSANVAGVLLARGRARRRELAIRMAIGASRTRLVRQLLAESLILAVASGTLGVLLTVWGLDVFARLAPVVPVTGRTVMGTFSVPHVDGRMLVLALGVTLAATVFCGLAPALELSRPQLTQALKEDGRSGGGPRRTFRALVVAEVALALLLLTAAGLLLDTFQGMRHLKRGFESDGVLTFWVRPPTSRYAVTEGPAIVARLLESIQRVPDVESAAVNRCVPFTGCSRTVIFFPDRPNDPTAAPTVGRHYISPDYFRTLGIPLIAGRALTDRDGPGRPAVTVINESAARRFWPGENPIGKRVWFGTTTGPFHDSAHGVEIVGVVGDVKYEAVDWPDSVGRPEFYTSYLQFCYPDTMIIVKARGSASALVTAMRDAVASVDPALPIYDVLTLDDRVSDAVSRPRFRAALVTAFAAAALLLAALGVYGLMSYSVSSRLREIGVRLALGATPPGIARVVLGEALLLTGVGAAIGIAAGIAAGRMLRTLVFGVVPYDPATIATATAIMIGVASAAALVPARRASAVDPIVVLRQE